MVFSSSGFEYLLKRYDAELTLLTHKILSCIFIEDLPDECDIRLHNQLLSALNEAHDLLDRNIKEVCEVINYHG